MALKIGTGYPGVNRTLTGIPKGVPLGLDLEWPPATGGPPTILGLAHNASAHSVEWDADNERILRDLLADCPELVGHNIIGADIPVLRKHMVFPLIPKKYFDTFIYFWLTNAHLCKARASKPRDYEYDDPGVNDRDAAGGFMNIWTMASLYTDLPQWKECRGTGLTQCIGPCPTHDVFGYNGIDALAPLIAREKLLRDAQLKKVIHLVPLYEKAVAAAALMQEIGILVDKRKIAELQAKIGKERESTLSGLPTEVNWNSWQQIKAFFKNKYGISPETTSEEDIQRFYEEYGFDEAGKLLDLKQVGRGLKSWFDDHYISTDPTTGLPAIHPSFKPCGGTATARWASSGPNFQNIPIRSAIGKEVRAIIIARPGYRLLKSDYKQAEARCVLYQAGYEIPLDFKSWLLDNINLDPHDQGVLNLGGVWNATKSFMHAGHYGEGITLHTRQELNTNYYVNLIAKGALEVLNDFVYDGKIVCLTGVNLAARMFGRATFENRRKALALQRRYFTKFPKVRQWQQTIAQQIEREGYVRSPFGNFLQLYGFSFPQLKTGLAMMGSNPVGMFTTLAITRAADDGIIPRAQVHDEILWELPDSWSDKKAIDQIRDYMEIEHEAMPGLRLPVDISAGASWGEGIRIYG